MFKSNRPKAAFWFGLMGTGYLTSTTAFAATGAFLKPDDFVGISFRFITVALVASTVFFFLERDRVSAKWKTSLTVFRYIDWLITVPLLMVEFFLILSAITKVPGGVFWRLMIGTLVMLVGGYLGEVRYMAVWPAFILGMAGWAFILYGYQADRPEIWKSRDRGPPAAVNDCPGTGLGLRRRRSGHDQVERHDANNSLCVGRKATGRESEPEASQ